MPHATLAAPLGIWLGLVEGPFKPLPWAVVPSAVQEAAVQQGPQYLTHLSLTDDLLLFDLDLLSTVRNAAWAAPQLPEFKSLGVTALQSRPKDGWVHSEFCSNL